LRGGAYNERERKRERGRERELETVLSIYWRLSVNIVWDGVYPYDRIYDLKGSFKGIVSRWRRTVDNRASRQRSTRTYIRHWCVHGLGVKETMKRTE
jgi:hypothetical protein